MNFKGDIVLYFKNSCVILKFTLLKYEIQKFLFIIRSFMFISMLLNLYMLYNCTYSAPSTNDSIVPKTLVCVYECTDSFVRTQSIYY